MMLTMLYTIEPPADAAPRRLEQLLLRTAQGDQEAFSALYQAARAPVYALALSILKNAHDAQDAAQDTFVRVWENAGSYRPQGSPMAWMLTIARNLALTRLRQGTRVVDLTEGEWDAIPAHQPGLTAEDRHVLQTALAALSDQERQIILLHAVSGLKHREIAQVLELRLATVLSKYHRGLKKLRIQLKGEGFQ